MGLHLILSEIMDASLDWSGHIVTILLFFFFWCWLWVTVTFLFFYLP